MMTRREAFRLLGAASASAWFAAAAEATGSLALAPAPFGGGGLDTAAPPLAPGAPTSAERIALIEAFKEKSEGLQEKFEKRSQKSDREMPYRLFRPEAKGKLPLVVYLHGSGGLGTDNEKQLG